MAFETRGPINLFPGDTSSLGVREQSLSDLDVLNHVEHLVHRRINSDQQTGREAQLLPVSRFFRSLADYLSKDNSIGSRSYLTAFRDPICFLEIRRDRKRHVVEFVPIQSPGGQTNRDDMRHQAVQAFRKHFQETLAKDIHDNDVLKALQRTLNINRTGSITQRASVDQDRAALLNAIAGLLARKLTPGQTQSRALDDRFETDSFFRAEVLAWLDFVKQVTACSPSATVRQIGCFA